jgi:hypothetical protein
MNDREFHVACAILGDNQKLIAAGKSQRWEIVKWAVTVNVALATASIALLKDHPNAGKWLSELALVVALIALLTMLVYNHRMKNTRNDAVALDRYPAKHGVDVHAITGKQSEHVGCLHDWQELLVYALILLLSAVLPLVVWMVGK